MRIEEYCRGCLIFLRSSQTSTLAGDLRSEVWNILPVGNGCTARQYAVPPGVNTIPVTVLVLPLAPGESH